VTNETITVFEFMSTDQEGVEHVFHRISLKEAAVSAIHQYVTVEPTGALEHRALEESPCPSRASRSRTSPARRRPPTATIERRERTPARIVSSHR